MANTELSTNIIGPKQMADNDFGSCMALTSSSTGSAQPNLNDNEASERESIGTADEEQGILGLQANLDNLDLGNQLKPGAIQVLDRCDLQEGGGSTLKQLYPLLGGAGRGSKEICLGPQPSSHN
ncbi:hypothetical protein NDU88_009895 [Pleurodeles waltl]|uniref:Uncharacterized protein n=1 Tax=Pleurodeles waltl TaxID=8319 RepID=A0AAV7S0B5_PLEWA|nr:hypothetical protein NDU88_009895 [Pleurodeles waltl]